jgi:hypothetical protein
LRFRLREAKPLELGQDRIDRRALVGRGRCSEMIAEPRCYIGDAQGTVRFQEDLENAPSQWPEQMAAAAALIAHNEFAIPLAPGDRVRRYAAPT